MTPAQVEWARCKPWIEDALATAGLWDISDIERNIAEGSMTFWPGENCAAVTEFIIYPNAKVMNIFAGGGEHHKSLGEYFRVFEPSLMAWAKAADCSRIMVMGREGWLRIGKRMGFSVGWVAMVKDITNER